MLVLGKMLLSLVHGNNSESDSIYSIVFNIRFLPTIFSNTVYNINLLESLGVSAEPLKSRFIYLCTSCKLVICCNR